jgi:catechol-2,3-dioxygenase
MPVTRLNHAVLYVTDLEQSVSFYSRAFGMTVMARETRANAAFLRLPRSGNHHDLGLFGVGAQPPRPRGSIGLYHLAWEVDTLAELGRVAAVLAERGALVGASDHGTTKALYARDPDGLEFEVSWLVPAALITPDLTMRTSPLDLDAEIARYGADTPGGIGVSIAALS